MQNDSVHSEPGDPWRAQDIDSDHVLEEEMIEELKNTLSDPAICTFHPGDYLLREGQSLDGVYVILDGQVQLFRTIDNAEVIFHAHTVGRIVGLLALTLGTTSYFDCRATTHVTAIRLTMERLQSAVDGNPRLGRSFAAVLMRTLARRNRRAVELQMEIAALNKTLAGERDHLATALQDLKNAESLLVETEKMATLGQISAGVAHELNNPTAAISRAADFIFEDTLELIQHNLQDEFISAMVENAYILKPCSTREERAHRKALAGEVGDRSLAATLVELGILTRADAERVLGSLDHASISQRLPELQTAHRLGSSLRNIRNCSRRITDLVRTLKSFARVDENMDSQVDLHEGLEESLLLLSNALRSIDVVKEYGDIPRVDCIPGQLYHVWTNILSNALQAMNGRGRIVLRTAPDGPDRVRVDIEDSGPGILPENLERIFDLNFTTRQGRVNYGLGMGLPICREIVRRHQGSLTVESEPGRTVFAVLLPIHPHPPPRKPRSTEDHADHHPPVR